jgi:hypothetical protein
MPVTDDGVSWRPIVVDTAGAFAVPATYVAGPQAGCDERGASKSATQAPDPYLALLDNTDFEARVAAAKARSACDENHHRVVSTFRNAVASSQACAKDSDCSRLAFVCPFGCGVAVSTARVSEVQALATRLLGEISRECRCMYKCAGASAPACQAGRCVIPNDD